MNDTLIVSIDEFSMSVLEKEGFYATKKPIKEGTRFIAFYRSLPIGGITCYAEIKEVCQGDRADVGAVYWMRNFPEQEPPYNLVRFKKIQKLKRVVKKDTKNGIQGPVYSTLERIKNTTKLSELLPSFK
jgi:hypothetical protein